MKLVCKNCCHEFVRSRKRKFCSTDCFHRWSKGKINKVPKTIQTRLKISNSLKGRCHATEGFLSPERGLKISKARKGMKFSLEHRKRLSDAKVRFLSSGGFHGKQTSYVSKKTGELNHAHSQFELSLMRSFDERDDITFWTKNHRIRLAYDFRDVTKTYIPDFFLEKQGEIFLVEAKGYVFDQEKHVAKVKKAIAFCEKQRWKYRIFHQRKKSSYEEERFD